MTDQSVDPEMFTDYQGKRVYFCCAKCRKTFLENPVPYLKNLPQFGGSPPAIGDSDSTGTTALVPGRSGRDGVSTDQDHDAMKMEQRHEENAGVPDGSANLSEGMEQRHDENIGHPHDHATDHGQPASFGRVIRFLGKFHPVVVHFPIALILTAALAEFLAIVSKKAFFSEAAFFCLVLGAIAAAIAVGLGWAAGAYAHFPEMDWVLSLHRWLGTGAGILALGATICAVVARIRGTARSVHAYRIVLFASAALVGVTGHFGAALIFGLDHFTF